MAYFQKTFLLKSSQHNELINVTAEVNRALEEAAVPMGQCTVFTPHATAAITVNESADPNIALDFLTALKKLVVEHAAWLHDRIDNNAAAHIKSAMVGPSVTIPIEGGRLCLGPWQNVFFCDFDGPRTERKVIVSILS
ncbi:MAG: secondary thiamine-phosphate synthase enzyme YjbQ [Myxococcales bacterium]|jgi:secondary thiamine-phosphate synthase enzyme